MVDTPRNILIRFGIDASTSSITPLGNHGGFSGAQLYQVAVANQPQSFCLRRWPNPIDDRARLDHTHQVLKHVFRSGVRQIAVPIDDVDGQSLLECDGSLWEFTKWLPGAADFHNDPSDDRLHSAMQTIAHFHRSAAALETGSGTVPAIKERHDLAVRYSRDQCRHILSAMRADTGMSASVQGDLFVDFFLKHATSLTQELAALLNTALPLQPCIRDVWHDHVLFERNRVSGLIDFGALRVDHVGVDLARLLGSLVGSDHARWESALQVYSQEYRSLDQIEIRVMDLMDRSNLLLSGLNWLRWLFVERRSFDDFDAVRRRMDRLAARIVERFGLRFPNA